MHLQLPPALLYGALDPFSDFGRDGANHEALINFAPVTRSAPIVCHCAQTQSSSPTSSVTAACIVIKAGVRNT
jgi:hypothetical protein